MLFKGKRKFRGRRKTRTKKSKSLSVKSVKKIAQSVVSKNVEDKYFEVSMASWATNINYDNHPFVDLCNQTTGTNDYTHIGDMIKLKAIRYRYRLRNTATTTTNAAICVRVIMFLWKQDNQVFTPADSYLFQQYQPGNGMEISFNDWDKMKQNKDYRVLYDATHLLGPQGGNNIASQIIADTGRITFKNLFTGYTGSTGMGKNHIYVTFFSDQGVPSTDIGYKYISRIEYEDA